MLVAVAMPALALSAHEVPSCTFTYKGQVMNQENILKLAPQAPPEVVECVSAFLKAHPAVAKLFSGTDYYQKLPDYDCARPLPITLMASR